MKKSSLTKNNPPIYDVDASPSDPRKKGVEKTSMEAWFVLFVLTLTYALNIADRYVISTLIEPIKNEFKLTDTSVGFLTGVSLALFYVAVGLPLGAIADKTNRKKMIGAAIAVWSAMTLACGLSQNFWHFLLARIGVGIGEAGGTPPSHSLISDKFSPKSRAFALSVWGIGASIGAWLGATGAGYLNEHYGWRQTLVIFGLAGLPLAAIVWLFVREPARGQADAASPGNAAPGTTATLKDTLRYMYKSKGLMHIMAAATMITFWGWGILWWMPSFLVRSFHLTVGEAGALLGPMHGIGGTILMVTTVVAMRYAQAKPMAWQSWFVAVTTLIGTVPSILLFFTTDIKIATLWLWIFVPIIYIYIGPTVALVQNLFPADMRAKGSAILLFVANIANLAVAPQLIGFLSDMIAARSAQPAESLRYVLLGCAFTGFWAAYHYIKAARYMKSLSALR